MLQSPVDWVLLDGRESSDDHGIVHYEWALLQGDSSVEMQVHVQSPLWPVTSTLLCSSFKCTAKNIKYIQIYLPSTKIRMPVQLKYLFHRNVEQPMLEGTSKDHLVQSFLVKGDYMGFSGILSNCILKAHRGGNSTPLLETLHQIKCSHGKKNSNIEMNPLLVQLVLVDFSMGLVIKHLSSLELPFRH